MYLHGFAMTRLFENFRSHVARCAAGGGENVKSLFVHDSREAKIGDEEVSVVFRGAEEEILGFEITMNDAMVVEVSDSGEGGAD